MILVHWITVVLIGLAVAAGLGREWLEGDLLRHQLLDLHRLLGLGVLGLSLARLALSRAFGAAKVNEHPTPVIGRAAAIGHGALYLALVVVPLLGWAQWSASGKTMALFAVLPVPALLGHDHDLADTLAQAHQVLAWLFLALICRPRSRRPLAPLPPARPGPGAPCSLAVSFFPRPDS